MSLSRCWGETGASRLPGALFAKANTDSTQCYRASCCLAEQFCAFDPSSFCFTLNVGPSDTGLLLRCFESFGPQHLFIAGSPNLREKCRLGKAPLHTHHTPRPAWPCCSQTTVLSRLNRPIPHGPKSFFLILSALILISSNTVHCNWLI